jgi:hypothetical protein
MSRFSLLQYGFQGHQPGYHIGQVSPFAVCLLRKADFRLRWFHFRRKLGEGKRPLAAVEREIAPYPVFIGNHPVGEGAHRFAMLQGDGQKGELKQGGQENQEITEFADGQKK